MQTAFRSHLFRPPSARITSTVTGQAQCPVNTGRAVMCSPLKFFCLFISRYPFLNRYCSRCLASPQPFSACHPIWFLALPPLSIIRFRRNNRNMRLAQAPRSPPPRCVLTASSLLTNKQMVLMLEIL